MLRRDKNITSMLNFDKNSWEDTHQRIFHSLSSILKCILCKYQGQYNWSILRSKIHKRVARWQKKENTSQSTPPNIHRQEDSEGDHYMLNSLLFPQNKLSNYCHTLRMSSHWRNSHQDRRNLKCRCLNGKYHPYSRYKYWLLNILSMGTGTFGTTLWIYHHSMYLCMFRSRFHWEESSSIRN